MRNVLAPVLASVAVVTALLALAGPAPTEADRGGCPHPHPTASRPHPTPQSQPAEGCHGRQPAPTPSPTPAPPPTPAPGADVKVIGMTVTAPATAIRGGAFLVTGNADLHNNGPDGPVNVDVTFTIQLPADCTASSATTVVVPNRTLSMSVPVAVGRSWNVTCLLSGDHQFIIDASAAITLGQTLTDPNPANNSGSGSASTPVN